MVKGASVSDALTALEHGWRIIPLWGVLEDGNCACPQGAQCGRDAGKHPAVSGGFHSAVGSEGNGPQVVRDWWARGTGAWNLGVRTGGVRGSGLLVIDIDIRNGGLESRDRWHELGLGDLPHLEGLPGSPPAVATGNGFHYYFRYPLEWLEMGRKIKCRHNVLPGIDIKADDGYVAGPASHHSNGNRYHWLSAGGLSEDGTAWAWPYVPAAPESLMRWAQDAGGKGAGGLSVPGWGGGGEGKPAGYDFRAIREAGAVGAGSRDVYFNDLAYRLRKRGVDQYRALEEVRREWERTEQPDGDVYPLWKAEEKVQRIWNTVPVADQPGGMRGDAGGAGAGAVVEDVPGVSAEALDWAHRVISGEIVEADEADDDDDEADEADEADEDEPLSAVVAAFQQGHKGITAYLGGSAEAPRSTDGPPASSPPPMQGRVIPPGRGHAGEGFGLTDTGNGERFAWLMRDRVRYVHEEDQWYIWCETDGYWKPDKVDEVFDLTKAAIADIRAEAGLYAVQGDSEYAEAYAKFAHASESVARRAALLRSASAEEGIRVSASDMDADAWLMALRGGGTLDLRDGSVRVSRGEDLITKCAGVSADEYRAGCEVIATGSNGNSLWIDHVSRMTAGDIEIAGWLQRMAGYSLTGDVREQCLAFLHADGENGKSMFCEAMVHVMGTYATTAQRGILTAGDEEHPVGMMSLRGARFVLVDEIGRSRLNETTVKKLTGGKTVKARGMGQNFMEFPMQAKIWVLGNKLPRIQDDSHGMWRRVRVVPLAGQLGMGGWKRVSGFGTRVEQEEAGVVLAWMVQGCVSWRELAEADGETGLSETQKMRETAREYRAEEDLFGAFLGSVLERVPVVAGSDGDGTGSGDLSPRVELQGLYTSYQLWMARYGSKKDPVLNINHFGRELRRAGYRVQRFESRGVKARYVMDVRDLRG